MTKRVAVDATIGNGHVGTKTPYAVMKLEDQFSAAMLAAGNKRSSIKSYWPHVVRYIHFTRERYGRWVHPSGTKVEDVYAWRRHLATKLQFSPKSQNQAVSAIKFLFARVLGRPISELDGNPLRAKEPKRCRRRVVAKPDLVKLFKALRPVDRLVSQLMYASVLRLAVTPMMVDSSAFTVTTTTCAGYFGKLSNDLASGGELRHTIFGDQQPHIYTWQVCRSNVFKTFLGTLHLK